MKIIDDNKKRIFKRVNEYGTFYSMGISKKNVDGNYINGFVPVKFKKNVSLEDKTDILLKDAWLDFYKSKNNETILQVFINDFDIVSIDSNVVANKEMESQEVFSADELVLTDDDLPF